MFLTRSRPQYWPSPPADSLPTESSEKTETPLTVRFGFTKAQEDAKPKRNAKNRFDPLLLSTIGVPSLSSSMDTSRTAMPVPIPAPTPTMASTNEKIKIQNATPHKTPNYSPNGGAEGLLVPPSISDPSPLSSTSSSRALAILSPLQGPLAPIRSGFHIWKAYLLSVKPSWLPSPPRLDSFITYEHD